MGCCPGIDKNINLYEKGLLIGSEETNKKKKEEIINLKEPFNDQNIQKTDKEEAKKEKSTIELNNQKSEKTLKYKKKEESSDVNYYKSQLKINKNKVIKKGSHRVQQALKELKLLSIEEINSNKKYFG